MKLPFWLRRIVATWKVLRAPEYGGVLVNWSNGYFDIIHEWKTDEEMLAALEITRNMLNSGRDEIYIALVKSGKERGYFVIHSGGGPHAPIAFWAGWVSFKQAFVLMALRCRQIGTAMGYRKSEEREGK